MQNVSQKWGKRLLFIKGLLAGSILTLVILGIYCGTYAVIKQDQCMVQHIAIIDALEKHLESGQPIPQNLSELASLEYINGDYRFSLSSTVSHQKDKYGFKYYPDAWKKPGRILLQSLVCGSYVITFGDGSRAIVSYWDYKPYEKKPEDVYLLHSMGAFSTLPVLVFFILLIVSLVTVLIVERVIKRRDLSV